MVSDVADPSAVIEKDVAVPAWERSAPTPFVGLAVVAAGVEFAD
jgi:hypothetical protein